jgi:hypothetical protein
MLIRNIQIFRLICPQIRYRFFSTTNIYLNTKQEQQIQLSNQKNQNDILPIENKLPAITDLPTYLPAPTGVKSKLFDDFYLIYRFGFHRPLRYIQVLKLAQTLAT